MVGVPLLQAYQVHAFAANTQARQLEQEAQLTEAENREEVKGVLTETNWDPTKPLGEQEPVLSKVERSGVRSQETTFPTP